jgi:hypothetical protein
MAKPGHDARVFAINRDRAYDLDAIRMENAPNLNDLRRRFPNHNVETGFADRCNVVGLVAPILELALAVS